MKNTILIATIFPYPDGGGMMSHIQLLKRGLELRGFGCAIVSSSQINGIAKLFLIKIPTKIISFFSREAATIFHNEVTSFFIASILFGRSIADKNVILNPQSAYCMPWVSKVARMLHKRLVLTVHGYATFEPISQGTIRPQSIAAKYYTLLEKKAYEFADFVVTVDRRIYDHVLSFGIPSRKTRSIKNFLDPDEFFLRLSPAEIDQLREEKVGASRDEFICLCPRRWVAKNGVEYALRAWKLLVERPHWGKARLILVGFGPEENNLRKLIRDLEIESSVIMKTRVEHAKMPQYFAIADLVLIPSIHIANVEEATSIAALESMAAGKPTIVTNIGGLRELVEDGKTGLVVPDKDPFSLAEAMDHLYKDPGVRAALGARARAYVVANHDFAKAADKFIEIYTQS